MQILTLIFHIRGVLGFWGFGVFNGGASRRPEARSE